MEAEGEPGAACPLHSQPYCGQRGRAGQAATPTAPESGRRRRAQLRPSLCSGGRGKGCRRVPRPRPGGETRAGRSGARLLQAGARDVALATGAEAAEGRDWEAARLSAGKAGRRSAGSEEAAARLPSARPQSSPSGAWPVLSFEPRFSLPRRTLARSFGGPLPAPKPAPFAPESAPGGFWLGGFTRGRPPRQAVLSGSTWPPRYYSVALGSTCCRWSGLCRVATRRLPFPWPAAWLGGGGSVQSLGKGGQGGAGRGWDSTTD